VFGFLGFTTGIVVLFGAILMFVSVLTGFPGPVVQFIGPPLNRVQREMETNTWQDLLAFEWALFVGLANAQSHQFKLHDRLTRRLATGITALVAGAAVLLTTLAFILGGAIIA
ncbi:MAG: hypothetical protein KY455_13665, partial [Euryarchaeota archaeon]|nr:hypothetical protein [Euryarchaeota archaeon]